MSRVGSLSLILFIFAALALAAPEDEGAPSDPPTAPPVDADGDGSPVGQDCNDGDPRIFPNAEETCDGKDNDCDRKVDEDASDAKTFFADRDADRFGNPESSRKACTAPVGYVEDNTDCNDASASIKPGAAELCDGKDNNCDGQIDEDSATNAKTWYADADGDGFGDKATTKRACSAPAGFLADARDCDDGASAINPGATEVCDGKDNDCDGKTDEPDASDARTFYADKDGDSFGNHLAPLKACAAPAGYVSDDTDCNDSSSVAKPGGEEVCDGKDNDCDGKTDEDDAADAKTWYQDKDADRFGNAEQSRRACAAPAGYVSDNTDCNDASLAINPRATEVCDGKDNNCDGAVDEDSASNAKTWYADSDGDSFGDRESSKRACAAPAGYLADARDCDDRAAAVNPSATEVCDGKDNDCDGKTDEPDASDARTFYADRDGDSFGSKLSPSKACSAPSGYVSDDTDCNDAFAGANPGATEVCDGKDNDCDGKTDEPDASDAKTFYADKDGDRFGDAAVTTRACSTPAGHVSDSTDCDDSAASVNPRAQEVCDGKDNNCDGSTDEDSAINAKTWYADSDGDSFGDRTSTRRACSAPSGFVADARDCDDKSGSVNPSAQERCDGADNDCDGKVDEPDAVDAKTFYADADLDQFGDPKVTTRACSQPRGFVSDDTDCNPRSAKVFPGADEYCDAQDNDCDGQIDEDDAVDAKTFYADRDGDRFGDERNTTKSCRQPQGYVTDKRDCDDSAADAYPGGREICDGKDNNCDGTTDEDTAFGAPLWYADSDGDTFGDSRSSRPACYKPSGYVEDRTDCDDKDDDTYPGAPEYCDGRDNNCDPTDEAGIVSFASRDGVREDLSARFKRGTADAPATWTADEPGTLTFCDGSYYANIRATVGDVQINSLHGATLTRLDGGGKGSVIVLTDGGAVDGLTIRNGSAKDSGGGIAAYNNPVTVRACLLENNTAGNFGGGVYVHQADLVMRDTVLRGNSALSGGGLYGYRADLRLSSDTVEDNRAVDGAGLYARFAQLTLEGTSVARNVASSQGGGVQLYGGAALSCVAVSGVGSIAENDAVRGGAIHVAEASTVAARGCDLSAGEANNDIYLDGVGQFRFGAAATFACRLPDGCQ